jgi:methylated-DNA-[protein]-cysteine S-methyltransferase
MVAYDYWTSPIGVLKVICTDDELLEISFVPESLDGSPNSMTIKVVSQLDEYFEGKRTDFDIPIEQYGTDFQRKCWDALSKIPYGETISYQEQAKLTGKPTASRAVGSANNKNKIPIVVPCHRVIAKNGEMAGYAGGQDKKIWLLEHEKKVKTNEKIRL